MKEGENNSKQLPAKTGWRLFHRNKQESGHVDVKKDEGSIGDFKMFPEGSSVHKDLVINIEDARMHGGILSKDLKSVEGFRNLTDEDKRWWEEQYARVGSKFSDVFKSLEGKKTL